MLQKWAATDVCPLEDPDYRVQENNDRVSRFLELLREKRILIEWWRLLQNRSSAYYGSSEDDTSEDEELRHRSREGLNNSLQRFRNQRERRSSHR